MDSLDNQTVCHMKFLRHLRDTWLRLSANAHIIEHSADCPHCEERTMWTVRMLNGYVRCRQCGRNPLSRDEPAPAEQPTPTTLQPDPHVSA